MWPCKWCPFMPTSPSSPDLLERCPFLALTLPWGPLCSLGLAQRNVSDDGPILWVRPGEQMIPTGELGPTPKKKRNTYVLIVSGGGGYFLMYCLRKMVLDDLMCVECFLLIPVCIHTPGICVLACHMHAHASK